MTTRTLPTGVYGPLPSGRYRFMVHHRNKRIDGVADTPEIAADMRAECIRKIIAGELAPTGGKSAKELGPRFLASRAGNRAASDDERRWHKHIAVAPWARVPVPSVTRKDGVRWLERLERTRTDYDPEIHGARKAKPLSWQTRRHCLNLARRFFEWCIGEEIIAANPFAGLIVEKKDGDEEEGYQESWYLDAEEQVRLLATWDELDGLDARDRAEKWIAAFAMATGLREGEQWCLHLADLHVDGPSPHVVVRYGSWDAARARYRPPKGRKGEKKIRRVDLWGLGLEAARAWLAMREQYMHASAEVLERRRKDPPNGMALVFPTERGARRDKKPVRSWARVVEAFGVVPRIGERPWWHLLRHTCASSLVSGWWGMRWSLEDVQAVLGHADIRTTQRYAHLAPQAVSQTAARAHVAFHAASTRIRDVRGTSRDDGRAREDSNL